MARSRVEQPLVASVLDRLLDDHPEGSREVMPSRSQQLRDLEQAVRRDLENLLNTRVRCLDVPAKLEELKTSLVSYGLPDFTGASMGTAQEREELGRYLQAVIRRFDPRFKSVRVQLLDNAEPLDRTLRFRIEGLLHAEPAPEPVAFDSILRPVTGDFQIKGVEE
jgi:type VI secretion system protein ImpF